MNYVLDSSVALKWVLQEIDSPKADALRRAWQSQLHDLLAPDVFPIECAHALSRAERKNIIQPPQGYRHLINILSTPPQLYSYLPLLDRAFEISSATRQGAYDCLYVALAEREGCELVTADDKLLKNLRPQFPFIVALASLP
jgi:predicted nucleic acid-binding protein